MKSRINWILGTAALIMLAAYWMLGRTAAEYPHAQTLAATPANPHPTAEQKRQGSPVTSSASATITLDECKNLFANNQTPDALETHKYYALSKFFRRLGTDQKNDADEYLIGDIAGLSLEDVRKAKYGAQPNKFFESMRPVYIRAPDNKNEPLSSKNAAIFNRLIRQRNYPELINALKQNPITANHTLNGNSLLSEAIKANPKISQAELQQLVDAGLPISTDTFAWAIQQKLPSDIIIAVGDQYGPLSNATWQEDQWPLNPALAAAKNLRADLYHYFTQKGGAAYVAVSKGNYTLLDVLPTPKNSQETAVALELATDALKQGLRPYKPSSQQRLQSWLPEAVQQQYRGQLQATRAPDQETSAKAEELKQLITDYDQKIARATESVARCKVQQHYDKNNYFTELLKQPQDSATLSLTTKMAVSDYLEKAAREKLMSNPQVTGQQATSETAKSPSFQKPLPPGFYDDIRTAATEKKWQEALKISDQAYTATNNPAVYNWLLHNYLRDPDANWDFISSLMDKGVQLGALNVEMLARLGKVNLLEHMVAQGVDLNIETAKGENALSIAVQGRNNEKMVDYLLAQGITTKPNTMGLDPLDLALKQMDTYSVDRHGKPMSSAPAYIAQLIQAGATIEQSHREKLSMLKDINPDAYNALITSLPALAKYSY